MKSIRNEGKSFVDNGSLVCTSSHTSVRNVITSTNQK